MHARFLRWCAARARLVLPLILWSAPAVAQGPVPADLRSLDGRALYLTACAGCHGADGRGLDRALVAFEEPLPDFTDCSFASREPAADWVGVAHEGGPLRAFSEMMPAFGEALGEDALGRVVAYVQTLCTDRRWPRGELNLPRALVTEKAFPEDEWVLETSGALEGPASLLHTLIWEKRFGPRSQVELALPFAHGRPGGPGADGGWSGGVGDLVVGFKQALVHGLEPGHIVSAVAEVKLPTGDRARGFGSGAVAFEGFLAAGLILPADGFLQLQAGAERSTREGAETELFWAGALGRSFTSGGPWGRTWSPMLEVLGRREGDEGTLWELLPQLHVTLSTRQHVMLTLGPRLPVGGEERPMGFAINVLWDWFDGGLLEGW